MTDLTHEETQRPQKPVGKPSPPYPALIAWVTLHAYLLAITSLWFPHVSIVAKAAITCSFLIGLGWILAFYLGCLNQWRALSVHPDQGA